MHHYVQPLWWRLLCPCTVGLGCDKKGDAFKYYRYAAFVHPLWSYGRPISSFSQEVLQTPKTFPKLAKLSQLHIMQCALCLQCWLVIIALCPLFSIHFPPHSSSEIKQQRVLHPISQQHKTFSPSKPSLHPELLLSEVLWTCEGGTDSKLPRTPQNKFSCTRMQRRLAHSSLQLSWELGMAAVELLLLLLVLLVVLGAKHSYPL